MKKTELQRRKRHKSIVGKLDGSNLPRLTVFRSSKHIYANLVDQKSGRTVFSVSDKDLAKKVTKIEKAKEVGKSFAEKALKNKVKKIVFDRAGYLYHGRVRALAEGAREGGLDF
jgi:large subunit ribosomal protein L18